MKIGLYVITALLMTAACGLVGSAQPPAKPSKDDKAGKEHIEAFLTLAKSYEPKHKEFDKEFSEVFPKLKTFEEQVEFLAKHPANLLAPEYLALEAKARDK